MIGSGPYRAVTGLPHNGGLLALMAAWEQQWYWVSEGWGAGIPPPPPGLLFTTQHHWGGIPPTYPPGPTSPPPSVLHTFTASIHLQHSSTPEQEVGEGGGGAPKRRKPPLPLLLSRAQSDFDPRGTLTKQGHEKSDRAKFSLGLRPIKIFFHAS